MTDQTEMDAATLEAFELARQIVVDAFTTAVFDAQTLAIPDHETFKGVAAGMMCGLAGICMAHVPMTDESHADLRAALISSVRPAMNTARACLALDPLPEA